jgi:hypothetical protein
MHDLNAKTMESSPAFMLVTGGWAEIISVASFESKTSSRVHYDPIEGLAFARQRGKFDGDVEENHITFTYSSTLTHYEVAKDQVWRLESTTPFESDVIVLPRVTSAPAIKRLMSLFSRAIRKSLRSSVIVAGGGKYREISWGRE